MISQIFNTDCTEGMKTYPDKYFDLAVVDPPYGLGKRTTDGGGTNSQIRFMNDIRRTNWDDSVPTNEYFIELFRVSKNQIIWGGNYFGFLPAFRCFIVWDKMTYIPSMSQVELAFTSFDTPARYVKINSNNIYRFHPTAKPIELYSYIYKNYLPGGGKVIDTHLGSGSNRIAADKTGNIDFIGYEIDKHYFDESEKKYVDYKKQYKISDFAEIKFNQQDTNDFFK